MGRKGRQTVKLLQEVAATPLFYKNLKQSGVSDAIAPVTSHLLRHLHQILERNVDGSGALHSSLSAALASSRLRPRIAEVEKSEGCVDGMLGQFPWGVTVLQACELGGLTIPRHWVLREDRRRVEHIEAGELAPLRFSVLQHIELESRLNIERYNGTESRISPFVQSQRVRHVSMSAVGEEHRWSLEKFTESDVQMERPGEEDLDYFMKSRYDQESLKSDEIESGEEGSGELVQLEEVEDLLQNLLPNDDGKFDNVVAVLGDPRVLAAAHERLNVRRRNWTLASNELEVSYVPKENRLLRSREIDWNWFKEAAHLLRSKSYQFKSVKRLDIVRRGRGEARQWAFVRPKDQVIQEAVRGILERIYEPIFSAHDSVSRPGTNVHSALKSVKYGWKGISWFLQFDVRITDHSLVQKRLLRILAEQIQDDVFLDILKQMFKVGSIWIDTSTDEDKPEGSVLSPVLGDIYFHLLDVEINRMREGIKSGSPT